MFKEYPEALVNTSVKQECLNTVGVVCLREYRSSICICHHNTSICIFISFILYTVMYILTPSADSCTSLSIPLVVGHR